MCGNVAQFHRSEPVRAGHVHWASSHLFVPEGHGSKMS